MSSYLLNWQDPETRAWHAVGKLFELDSFYIFAYTHGALQSKNFVPFGNLNETNSYYVSNELFPIFANRVMNSKRPDYVRYATWAGLDSREKTDPLKLMARMGGAKATDSLQVYQIPERDADGNYKTTFFTHGLSHLPEDAQNKANLLKEREQLYPLLDVQNPYDPSAVALRSNDPSSLIGYCPRYLARDISELALSISSGLEITVRRVNKDAPPQFKLLCEASAIWPGNFEPCSSTDHKTIVDFEPARVIGDFKKRNSV
ncbi:HIRAN domain-containing protein [Brucella pituitosa]|uniref:HIRAN domain-containing protein n=1 Tax=Brucella pituitosa TaxID=571256 RepID=UPI003C793ACD